MKHLKVFVISLIVIAAIVLFGVSRAHAVDVNCDTTDRNNTLACLCTQAAASDSATCRDVRKHTDPTLTSQSLLGRVISIVFFITGVAAIIAIIVGGIEYMISTGDSAKVNKAKDTILYAAIGLIISVFAQVIVRFVVNKF